MATHTPVIGPAAAVGCPRCSHPVPVGDYTCANCGFPMVCDLTPVDSPRLRARGISWRLLLGLAGILFWLVHAVFLHSGSAAYHGQTAMVAAQLTPDADSGIPITGPDSFVLRTELALGLLKQRAPDYYFRLVDNIESIEFLAPSFLKSAEGKTISLEGIGAMAEVNTGNVMVLYNTAFPRGVDQLTDYCIFSYAGVLIHEMRHIELHRSAVAPGGWREEEMCEQAAYSALKKMNAPGGVLVRYDMYLHDPQAPRYQQWYDWYKQW
jgi:hypothetical protein